MGDKAKLKKNMILRWGMSYFAVCLLPLIVFVIFALSSSFIIRDSTEQSNQISLSSISSMIDTALDQTASLSEDIFLSSVIKPVLNTDLSGVNPQTFYEATNEFRHLVNGYGNIEDALIFSKDFGLYLSGMRWGNMDDLYLRNELTLPFTQEETRDIFLNSSRDLQIFDASLSLPSGARNERILVIRPLSYARSILRNDIYLATVVNISDLFPDELVDFHNILLLDKKEESIIFDFLGDYTLDIEQIDFDAIEYGKTISVGDTMVSFGRSDGDLLFYAIAIEKDFYFRYTDNLFKFAVGLFLLSLIGATFFILRKIRMEWRVYERAIELSGLDVDELSEIKDAYTPFVDSTVKLLKEQEMMGSLIEEQTASLRSHTLSRLVDISSGPVSAESLSECGIEFISNSFLVIIASSSEEAKENVSSLIVEKLSDSSKVFPFPSTHGSAFIVNPSEDDADSIYEHVAHTFNGISKDNGIYHIAASDLVEGLENVGKCYLDAITVLEYEKSVDSDELMFYRDVVDMVKKTNFFYSSEDELALKEALTTGNSEKAISVLDGFIEANKKKGITSRGLRYLLFTVTGTVIRTSNRLKGEYGWDLPSLYFSSIIQSEDFNASYQEVSDGIRELSERIASFREESPDVLDEGYSTYRKALRAVENGYMDSMMNVSELASRLEVSNVYLSKVFKKFHGKNISEYIASYRISKAKELLAQGYGLNEIVDKCGFGSTRTFMRLFKSHENITPSQFRTMRKEEHDG